MSPRKKVKKTLKQAESAMKGVAASTEQKVTPPGKKLPEHIGFDPFAEKACAAVNQKKIPVFVESREVVWRMRLEKVASVLKKNGFAVSVVESLSEAADIVIKEILPATCAKTVSFGGSMTVREAGLLEMLAKRENLEVLNTYDFSIGLDAMIELRRQSLLVDLFISSANAVTEDGTLMLLDGVGNRAAAVQFGPQKVVLIIGRNKLCSNMEEGIKRVQNLAAPANAMRLKRKTPCVATGICMNCSSPERICSTWTMTVRSFPKERIHVILVNDEAGF